MSTIRPSPSSASSSTRISSPPPAMQAGISSISRATCRPTIRSTGCRIRMSSTMPCPTSSACSRISNAHGSSAGTSGGPNMRSRSRRRIIRGSCRRGRRRSATCCYPIWRRSTPRIAGRITRFERDATLPANCTGSCRPSLETKLAGRVAAEPPVPGRLADGFHDQDLGESQIDGTTAYLAIVQTGSVARAACSRCR